MPNHCWNKITITGSKEDIYEFTKNECKDVPEWALKIHDKGLRGIYFDIWSPWVADFEWLESLLVKYPSVWVKDLWHAEDGQAGAGQAMKLAVNLIVHTLNAAVSEGLALATASGIEASAAYDVFDESVVIGG